ncbi:hypothetical protein [Solibacillus sp. FSL K6-1523]|uniref:hypothetical protein n=1 Tax=Solibacillus sp. FSL K6-1523 TaxID=2921471 RepID=UPI0030F54D07
MVFEGPTLDGSPGNASEDPGDLTEMGQIKGREFAYLHNDTFVKEKKDRFNVFGLEEIVYKINSPSFEYELGESIKTYKSGLYLAAAATGGITLENILRILIVNRLGTDQLPKNTYIL